MKNYTEMDLATGDYSFFFKQKNTIIQIANNGKVDKRFLNLDPEKQDKVFNYFYDLKNSTSYSLNDKAPEYPDNSAFTMWAKKGIYAYDFHEADNDPSPKMIVVSEPINPLTFEEIPAEILDLLTEF